MYAKTVSLWLTELTALFSYKSITSFPHYIRKKIKQKTFNDVKDLCVFELASPTYIC